MNTTSFCVGEWWVVKKYITFRDVLIITCGICIFNIICETQNKEWVVCPIFKFPGGMAFSWTGFFLVFAFDFFKIKFVLLYKTSTYLPFCIFTWPWILLIFFQVLDREGQIDNPCPGWLTDIAWDNLTELDKYVQKIPEIQTTRVTVVVFVWCPLRRIKVWHCFSYVAAPTLRRTTQWLSSA